MHLFLLLASAVFAQVHDPRNIGTGSVIPDEFYADQPYIVKTNDGAWLCVITTGPGAEGSGGQHVVSRRSTDRGKTWENAVDIEPNDGPEASYAVMLKANSGRIYVADRANNRIQIFDKDGKFLNQWTNFGVPWGVTVKDDLMYVVDGTENNCLLIARLKDGTVIDRIEGLSNATAVAVDSHGAIYVGEVNGTIVK